MIVGEDLAVTPSMILERNDVVLQKPDFLAFQEAGVLAGCAQFQRRFVIWLPDSFIQTGLKRIGTDN